MLPVLIDALVITMQRMIEYAYVARTCVDETNASACNLVAFVVSNALPAGCHVSGLVETRLARAAMRSACTVSYR